MPDGLPDTFWDAQTNQIKTTDLINSYKELAGFKSEYDARINKRPESPDKYELRIPEGVKIPEGMDFKFDEKSPLLNKARELVFNAGGDQALFDDLAKTFIEQEFSQIAAAEEAYKAELSALGEKANERIDAAKSWLTKALPEEQAKALMSTVTSKAALEAIETLINKSKDATMQSPNQGSPSAGLTQESLTEMQKDPRYWRERNPDFVRMVQEGYEKLYPGPQQRIR